MCRGARLPGTWLGMGRHLPGLCTCSPLRGCVANLFEAFDCSGNWGPSLFAGNNNKHRSFNISEPRINERIRVPEVRLVGPAGEQVGIVRIEDALRLAAESDLDLVEVAPQAKPPVCKLMDFGKYKYEAAVKAREARKNQTNTVLKEIRFRLKIDTHDYETKRGHALRFLGAGDKVKAMIQFRGREQQRPEMGIRLLQRFADDVAEVGVVESSPRIDGRNMVMVVGPLKNKAEAKAEARRATQRAEAKAQNEAKASGRVDTSGQDQAPMTQSLADLLPEGFTVSTEPQAAAPEQEVPKQEAPKAEAPKQEAPKAAAPKQEAPKQEAPKAAAPKQEAPKAAAPKAAPAPKPAAAKPEAAAPAAPKPAAVPAPPKPVARPAAPKPAARPAPKAVPKPAGKKTN
ncbi:translation initiation factor 3 (bIF-3) [Arthrobacter sp. SLBN-83]|nr:translation initiation factor 3 (bIF-3) [Arthrobacter sp. SLBN-83]